MSTLKKNVRLTPDEYIEGEQYSHVRHEFVGGRLLAMVGVSAAHNRIAINLVTALHTHLRGTGCQVFVSDMKVRVGDDFYYPDVFAACDPADRHDFYRERPALIVEILSPSTEKWDTISKRAAYSSLASLEEYVPVAQAQREVQVYRRAGDAWDLEIYGPGDAVRFDSVDLSLPIDAIYEEVL